MPLLRTCCVRFIFKKGKLERKSRALIKDMLGQIYFQGEKIESRISRTDSGLDGSDLFLRREN